MRHAAAQARGDDRVERRLLRAGLAHHLLEARGDLDLRAARADEVHDVLEGLVGNGAGAADVANLLFILDLAQDVEVEGHREVDARQPALERRVVRIDDCTALEADMLAAEFQEDLRRLLQEAVAMLDDGEKRRLLLGLLRVAVVRDEQGLVLRDDERRVVAAEAAEVMKVHVFGHDDCVEPLLLEKRAQCGQTVGMQRIIPLWNLWNIRSLGPVELVDDGLERGEVALDAEAADLAHRHRREYRRVAELLALVDVREVHLDDWHVDRRDGVADGDAVMREGRCVEDDEVELVVGLLDGVDEVALVVRLVERRLDARLSGARGNHRVDIVERRVAVDLRLTRAEHIEVRPMQYKDTWHKNPSI